MKQTPTQLAGMWSRHSAEWRDTAQVASQWREAARLDRRLLRSRATGDWWDILDEFGITLLVTREYEHLMMALSARSNRRETFFPMPHPSGLAVDRKSGEIHVASTRNPNQVFTFRSVAAPRERPDVHAARPAWKPFVPVTSYFYPGCMYLHDLALIGGALHGNAVGQNAVVRLLPAGFERVWWPRSIEVRKRPVFERNYLQLNSIAAGSSLSASYFTASAAAIGRFRPGHSRFPVDGRGVVFSGRTREPICEGLTRPHSARLWRNRVWLANSGYGEVGFVSNGRFEVVARLNGWTRGLCILRGIAFVATSRVIPRYAYYAPGLDAALSRCGVHAISTATGKVLGSIEWPLGNQVFAVDWIHNSAGDGFPFDERSRKTQRELKLFYSYRFD